MPVPVSLTVSTTYSPGVQPRVGCDGVLRREDVCGLDRQPAAVGHGIACIDREVEDRVLELVPGRPARGPGRAPSAVSMLDVFADASRRSSFASSAGQPIDVEHLWLEQLLASEGQQLTRERRPARRRPS